MTPLGAPVVPGRIRYHQDIIDSDCPLCRGELFPRCGRGFGFEGRKGSYAPYCVISPTRLGEEHMTELRKSLQVQSSHFLVRKLWGDGGKHPQENQCPIVGH